MQGIRFAVVYNYVMKLNCVFKWFSVCVEL